MIHQGSATKELIIKFLLPDEHMLIDVFNKLFRSDKVLLPESVPVAVAAAEVSNPEPFNPYTVHGKSMQASGWFNHETGELFRGFPISEADVVLDIGCGGGGNANFCASRGAHIVFADIDSKMVAETERILKNSAARKIEAIVTDANPLPLPDGMFTRVVSTEVIEHVDDPRSFLKELARVGKPGALYLLAVPDPAAEEIYKQVAHPSYFEHPNHIRVIEHAEFEQLVADAGLEVIARDFYGVYFTIWWAIYWADWQDGPTPRHPALDAWATTWDALLKCKDGLRITNALDKALPKSQLIIARKL
jgi:ubiquinone/menaquinone biosynthesis C-methylase UbiE